MEYIGNDSLILFTEKNTIILGKLNNYRKRL